MLPKIQKFNLISGEYWHFWVTVNELDTSITGFKSLRKFLENHQMKCLCGKQAVHSKDNLWIDVNAAKETGPNIILKKLTSSVDERLLKVTRLDGDYIKN